MKIYHHAVGSIYALCGPITAPEIICKTAAWGLTSDTAETPLESRLDNPNYFEGDLDISQAIIDALYEQQSGKDVRI